MMPIVRVAKGAGQQNRLPVIVIVFFIDLNPYLLAHSINSAVITS